jgi:hypothetical protein
MINGAEFINSGDKYSEEVNLNFYNEIIQSDLSPEELLKRLKPLYN